MKLFRRFKHRDEGYGERYTHYIANRTKAGEWFLFHRIIPNTLAQCRGKILDLGCGIGDVLRHAPAGSSGLEISESNIEYCRRFGIDVRAYDPVADDYRFADLEPGAYQTLLMSHVLEHLSDTARTLAKILASCRRLGMERVVVKVPGAAGFKKDSTHVTFVDRHWLEANQLTTPEGWRVGEISYYPFDAEWVGRYFLYNEMIIVYVRS